MMDRAIELAADHGIGLVALRNANHWMRGGSYGWRAAEKRLYWHLLDQLHRRNAAVGRKRVSHRHQPADRRHSFYPNPAMVDMSMSMFSYGMLEVNRLAGRQLPVDGGFDDEGRFDQRTWRYREKIASFCRWATGRFGHVDCAGYDRYPPF